MASTRKKAEKLVQVEGAKDPSERIDVAVPYDNIVADHTFNVRKQEDGKYPDVRSLVADIRVNGLLSPLTVRPGPGGKYLLVAGFRRLQALQELREGRSCPSALKNAVPCVIKEYDDLQAYLVNLTENLSREDIDMFDLGERCVMLAKKFDMSGGDLAKKLGYHRTHINFTIAIQNLPKAILTDIYERREAHKTDKKIKTPPADVLKQLCFRCKTDGETDKTKQVQAYDLWKSGGAAEPEEKAETVKEDKPRSKSTLEEMAGHLSDWLEADNAEDVLEKSEEWLQGAYDALCWALQRKGHKRDLVAPCEFEGAEAAE